MRAVRFLLSVLSGVGVPTISGAVTDTAAPSCPSAIVYKHSTPRFVFQIKRQANCHFQGLQWETGKKKETLHGLNSHELFTDAAQAVNNAMEVMGLERQDIKHSNIFSAGRDAGKGNAIGGSKKAVDAAAAAVASAKQQQTPDYASRNRDSGAGSGEQDIDDITKIEAEIEAEEAQEARATATAASAVDTNKNPKNKGGLTRGRENHKEKPAAAAVAPPREEFTAKAGTMKARAVAATEAAAIAAVARPPPLTAATTTATANSPLFPSQLLKPTAPRLNKIERVVVVGERNTGTNWLFRTLEENFNTTVLNHFCGWKHFFHHPSQCSKIERSQKNTTLAIVLWKNVFDWTLSMHRNPYHMHMHFRNSFASFVRRPMALVDTYALSSDPNLLRDRAGEGSGRQAQPAADTRSTPAAALIEFNHKPLAHNLSTNSFDNLTQYDLFCPESPQHLAEYSPPFYELNPDTQRPFANLVRMRSAKIKNFKNMQTWMPNVDHIRFEELLNDGGQGALDWLERVADKWGLQPRLKRRRRRKGGKAAGKREEESAAAGELNGMTVGGADDAREEEEEEEEEEERLAAASSSSNTFPMLVVDNPKHPGEAFNCTAYEAGMFYSSCLRGIASRCCSAMGLGDATFIAEQLDRQLESDLEYVMPNVRDLCGGGT
eukprot:CAMPEP_0171705316 /NCGR_PEP_ID=MMETSP0991-20121206/13126_1 /TAXON_ID=483369 /ORGANISM="non described non described, Strain CCMP2098" /LENGTH=661 /DNA_ID=CAMNT_0012294841 /DNA_START=41 /DNA_END=2027 /DNA_ORIENTATION=-